MAPLSVLPMKPGPPSAMARLVNPLVPNGAPEKLTGGMPAGRPVLLSCANAPRAVIWLARLAAVVNCPPATAALYCATSAALTPPATSGLKQVGETPGATMLGATAPKFAATRQ